MEIKAKKEFGQNFLTNQKVIDDIITTLGPIDDALVIEIGPGRGALTKKLVKKAKCLLAYEIDKDLIKLLQEEIPDSNFILKNCDILTANIKEDIETYGSGCQSVYVVGNLPYYITTPIMLKLIEENLEVAKYLFMVQEEVADRYTSLENNKDYNSLTVYLNYLFFTHKCFVVPNTSFYPIPKVSSAIISLVPRANKLTPISEEYFFMINKLIFRQKRKTLHNNLKDKFSSNVITKAYDNLGFKPSIRAEELSILDIVNLADELLKLTNVYEKAHAKINLTLRVFPAEGSYHPINSLMVPLDLADDLIFTFSEKDTIYSNVAIENNILLKTLALFKATYNLNQGVSIYLRKSIPLAAGLAGGSSDSAACLRGLNRLFNLHLKLEELTNLANQLGSDNNFCLYSRPAICSGRGEKLEFIAPIKELSLILIKPNFGLSTKEIYDNYKFLEANDTTNLVVKDLTSDCSIPGGLFNDLEAPALQNKKYQDFVNKLNALGVITYQSGSGPTRYSFKISDLETIKKAFPDCFICLTKLTNGN